MVLLIVVDEFEVLLFFWRFFVIFGVEVLGFGFDMGFVIGCFGIEVVEIVVWVLFVVVFEVLFCDGLLLDVLFVVVLVCIESSWL